MNQSLLNVVTDKYRHDFSYNWEYLAKNFDTISDVLIIENDLLKLNLPIWVLGYLKDRPSCFIEVIKDKDEDEKEQDNEP